MITIVTVLDVVGALAQGALSENFYLFDDNRINGSTGQGTEELKTSVREEDWVVWTSQTLECEAFAQITAVLIDSAYCKPTQHTYPGTDITYWKGRIKAPKGQIMPYSLRFKVGRRVQEMSTSGSSCLVGGSKV